MKISLSLSLSLHERESAGVRERGDIIHQVLIKLKKHANMCTCKLKIEL
jgi:hypothetical protein